MQTTFADSVVNRPSINSLVMFMQVSDSASWMCTESWRMGIVSVFLSRMTQAKDFECILHYQRLAAHVILFQHTDKKWWHKLLERKKYVTLVCTLYYIKTLKKYFISVIDVKTTNFKKNIFRCYGEQKIYEIVRGYCTENYERLITK